MKIIKPLFRVFNPTAALATRRQLLKRRAISRIVLPASAISILLLSLHARADASASSTIDFPNHNNSLAFIPWAPGSGSGSFGNAQASVSAQAGANSQSDSGTAPSVSASDSYSQASASAFQSFEAPGGTLSSSSSLPNIGPYSSAQASASVIWQATVTLLPFFFYNPPNGTLTQVEVSLGVQPVLTVSTSANGQSAQAGYHITGTILGGQYTSPSTFLSLGQQLSIGPNTSQSYTLNFPDTLMLGNTYMEYGVPYQITLEADVETYVSNVPDSGSTLTLLGIAMLAMVPLASKFRRARVDLPPCGTR